MQPKLRPRPTARVRLKKSTKALLRFARGERRVVRRSDKPERRAAAAKLWDLRKAHRRVAGKWGVAKARRMYQQS